MNQRDTEEDPKQTGERQTQQENADQKKESSKNTGPKLPKCTQEIILMLYGDEAHNWDITHDRQMQVLYMMAIQNGMCLAIVLFVKFMAWGERLAYIPFPFDIILLLSFIICLLVIQFGDQDYKKPPLNRQVFFLHFLLRTVLICWITFAIPRIHFEWVIAVCFIDTILMILFFYYDKSSGVKNCFSIWDNKFRIIITFMLQEIITNLLYVVTSGQEVYAWFATFFFQYCYQLLFIQMVKHRKYIEEYNNEFYLALALFDGDLLFPCNLIAQHLSSKDQKDYENQLILQ